jgi:hypothetical protein
MKKYASWGSDSTYRWLWRAALQDAIFAFRKRLGRSYVTSEDLEKRKNVELEELLRDCASKLESQVVRDPELPASYAETVKKAFSILNTK